MTKRDHLRRLPPESYQGDAMVHWSLTIMHREIGWLDVRMYYRFRELLTHTCFRYGLCVPIFCLMPDHLHMLWMGLQAKSDQLLAMKHFRKTLGETLSRIEFELQDQSYDHVLRDDERKDESFREVCNYIASNPERAGLVPVDGYSKYLYSGCLIPGYPELRPFEENFWNRFDRTISFLRKEGLQRFKS